PFCSFSPLTAPTIIPIEEKLANDTKKIETIPVARADMPVPSLTSNIATNSFVTIFVAIKLPASTRSFQGTPMIKARGDRKSTRVGKERRWWKWEAQCKKKNETEGVT